MSPAWSRVGLVSLLLLLGACSTPELPAFANPPPSDGGLGAGDADDDDAG